MFLKKRKVNGILYWSLVESYRDNGKVKQRIVQNLGNTVKAIELLKSNPKLLPYLDQILNTKPDVIIQRPIQLNSIIQGDCLVKLKEIPDNTFHTCVTSPPYWGLRDYGIEQQLGLEETPEEYIQKMVMVFREVRRVLRDDGTLWLNLGDSYATGKPKDTSNPDLMWSNRKSRKAPPGLKQKDLVGIPWMVALALRNDGWYLRMDNIWHKPNCMPESVKDRPTRSHEYIFLLSKSPNYYYDYETIKERAVDGDPNAPRGSKGVLGQKNKGIRVYLAKNLLPIAKRNKRSVWSVTTKPFKEAHFATFPPDLVEPCILAGSPQNGIVLDPFFGSGTTGLVALRNNRNFVGIELNEEYIQIANRRLNQVQLKFEIL
ncbi:MAG: DNA-methyltransferase [Tepidibacillus sp.]